MSSSDPRSRFSEGDVTLPTGYSERAVHVLIPVGGAPAALFVLSLYPLQSGLNLSKGY
ncbi:DUF1795 domain-containing protein [Affinibrenneria salicis]|uniref:DUF1795 domain-containing protein n=1 Tax=Affinibrenneria salicis TaxID=2590031 RepID=A0A5J5FY68_9GAMM|nr:DUF1795 domain-containing protein [Affinibrenneria salicis]KAA8999055.1 DUF1795 domain-containing protein [Affinibrenneria salicis]